MLIVTHMIALGEPVASIDVEAPSNTDANALRRLIAIEPGYLLDQTAIQTAIKRIYALDHFSQVKVYTQHDHNVIHVRFVISPRETITDIIGPKDLSRALNIRIGDEITRHTEQDIISRAKAWMQRQGYPEARIQITMPASGVYHINVEKGTPVRIAQMSFVGSPRLPMPIVQDNIALQAHDVLNLDVLKQAKDDLKNLYIRHGFLFASIQTQVSEYNKVTWRIVAGDRIFFDFVGNHVLSHTDLHNLWRDIMKNSTFNAAHFKIFQQRIIRQYQRLGYSDVTVDLKVFRDAPTQSRIYRYAITENLPIYVEHITYDHFQALPKSLLDEQIQKTLISTLEKDEMIQTWKNLDDHISIIPADKRWVKNIYNDIAEQFAAAYHDIGYLSARVRLDMLRVVSHTATTYTPAQVMFHIDEGAQTFIKDIHFSGNQAIAASQMLEALHAATTNRDLMAPMIPGAPLSHNATEDGRVALEKIYKNQGYWYVQISVSLDISRDNLWASVSYHIDEGPQVRIDEILIRGNTYTKEELIRNRISTKQHDLYRLEQTLQDQRTISSLGVFKSVRVKLIDKEHPSESKDIITDVTERNRHMLEIAPGLSTAQGPRLSLSYNFINLFGRATALTLSLKVNRQIFFSLYDSYQQEMEERYKSYIGFEQISKALEREARIGLRSPNIDTWYFKPLLRVDLVDKRVNAIQYSLDSATLIFGIDTWLPAHLKISLESQIGLTGLECTPGNPTCNQNRSLQHLQNQSHPIDIGERWTFKSGPLIVLDRRNDPLNPSSGFYSSARVSHALGAARPDDKADYRPFTFNKYELGITGYVPLWQTILALSARGGTIQITESNVPIDERFFLGGRDTLRGFVEGALIPDDACVVNANHLTPNNCIEEIPVIAPFPPLSLGGDTFLLLKSELRLPLGHNLFLDLFLDVGNLWVDIWRVKNLRMRLGTGFGLRYATPVGALTIDLGFNPYARTLNQEPLTQLHFSIGSF